MKKYLLILLLFTISHSVYSQVIKKFSFIEEEFFEQLHVFFDASGSKKELAEMLDVFKVYWSEFDTEKKDEIIETCNAFLNKRGKPAPHFLHYFQAIIAFSEKQHPLESYNKWNESLQYIILEKNIRFADQYCETTIGLLKNRDIYKSYATRWNSLNSNFSFEFDEVPTIKFDETTIVCHAKNDSIYISNTKGIYYPLDNEWSGENGRVNWKRAGFGENSVYADVNKYNIDMKKSTYSADSVFFTNKTYYDKTILGSLTDKVIAYSDPEMLSYPRFDSYDKIFEIKGIYPGIDYKGGFSMHGAKFIGSGNKESLAYVTFFRNDTVFMKTKSDYYIFRKDYIVARNSAVAIYIKNDSIYHPGLRLKYNVKDREVLLIRDDDPQNMSRSPYYDTYHKIDMDFEQLTWNIENDEMKMGTLKGSIVSKAKFESANYFQEIRYLELGMNDQIHPLVALRRYARKYGTEEFQAEDFADYLEQSLTQVRHLCMRLSYKGVIDYNIATEKIKLKKRLYEYLDARVGKIDYDVIKFDSEHDMIGLENASLDLKTHDLKLYGVSKIQVSDSQNVVFYPRGRQLLLKENRNFEFDGIIEAGLFEFFGQNFTFNYNDFKIKLESIDSMKIKVESFEVDAYGMKKLVNIQNVIENITGDLLIDDPNNKSSVKHFPEYPIFNSKESSYVFYDYYNTQNGVYDRERFYFALDPYTVDSLNRFTTGGLSFEGEFVSANILPVFREKLTVQKDYSLGFTRLTPPEGYPIYEGKATFYDTINMSNVALRGYGKIKYLNSEANSTDGFYFLPDSMNALVDDYTIAEQTIEKGAEFPQVDAQNLNVHWEPYNDKWDSEQIDSAIVMYNGNATLEGGTNFTPEGLHGWGKFQFDEAVLQSESYTFKQHEVIADTSDFDLISDTAAKTDFAFKTKNVKTYVNFEEKKATFTSNDKVTVVQFPQNKYICYLDKFTWDMETKEITLGSDVVNDVIPNENQAGAHFISVHPDQDTLNFVAPAAKYDLNKYIITANEVKQIDVANSRIFPGEEGLITVYQNAKMETLKEAKMFANRINKQHELYDATLNITGRMAFSGSGKYDYVDEVAKKQTLLFSHISVDSVLETYATGAIPSIDSFTLSPNYKYQGDVRLNSTRDFLSFDGSAYMIHECDTMKSYWFQFKDEIDPNDIFIPISSGPKSIDNKRIYASIFMAYDSTHIYSSFLSNKVRNRDHAIISAYGYLHYDKKQKKYAIAQKNKLLDDFQSGNMLTFHREFCLMFGEGELNLGFDLGQINLKTYGTISHNIPRDNIRLETVMAIDFFFPDELLKSMSDTLANNMSLPSVDLARKVYQSSLVQILGEEKGQEMNSEINLYGSMKKLPDELMHTIVFNQLNLVWDQNSMSYKSVGKIGIQNILGKQVNKQVDGYFELKKRRSGDELNIYIELSKRNWYFFNYSREIMQACSSDDLFNLFIDELKDKDKILKVNKKEARYSFYLSSETRKKIFIKKFLSNEVEVENNSNSFNNDSLSENSPMDSLQIEDTLPNTDSLPGTEQDVDTSTPDVESTSPAKNETEFKLPDVDDSKKSKKDKYKSKTGGF